MAHALLTPRTIATPAAQYLSRVGRVFAVFDAATQDSGNVSYGVEVAGARFFVKTAGSAATQDAPGLALDHGQRAALLRNAAELARRVSHPALATLRHVIESPDGPCLVYDWAPGALLHARRDARDDPASGYQRFRALPPARITAALEQVYDAHAALADAGFVAQDFYDGCLIYDFEAARVRLIDLDMYHRGPFTNTMGRMFGSTRFMAPEELSLGATIDERTTVFNLGRAAAVFLSDGSLARAPFRGNGPQHAVMVEACQAAPSDRHASVDALLRAFRAAMDGT